MLADCGTSGKTPVESQMCCVQEEAQATASKPEDPDVGSLLLAESGENGKTGQFSSTPAGGSDTQHSTEAGNGALRKSEEPAAGESTSGESLTAESRAAGESQDSLAEAALMTGLHSVTDKELPLLISEFWAKHMKPAGRVT